MPEPDLRSIDAGRDAARPRLDAARPLDATLPVDSPRARSACRAGACASVGELEPLQWNPPLPICLADGGAPPPGEGRSSLTRCNQPGCRPELSPCDQDEDCCQPEDQPHSFAVCPAARKFCTLVNRSGAPLAPQCLADGGTPEWIDAGPTCAPRRARCDADSDCCQLTTPQQELLCVAGFCDLHAL
jgi:hypothetical protein